MRYMRYMRNKNIVIDTGLIRPLLDVCSLRTGSITGAFSKLLRICFASPNTEQNPPSTLLLKSVQMPFCGNGQCERPFFIPYAKIEGGTRDDA